ncbi:3'-5' exonuclease [Marinigracilibium pacificum]|uniref:3'-5' exonuclease n=1 Tax=Marinigracilibium pacificum TaxID=2729599 RepID=A0A848J4K7_9BACT|nr:3'-5' exonuclease [Marinigracilibium pacificum]NMM48102.1 3'-5' exonuclease [Marinigracilibium pacificum]
MYLNLKSPLAFFDLETTGTNISHDRIVEISIVKAMPDGKRDIKTLKINPEMPIPEEVSLIHGIRDEDVKDAPTFKQVAKELAKFLEGADLAGYNIVKFDIPVLVEEFLRADIDFDLSNRKLIDAQKIFFMMEKRTLSAAYQFYCNKNLEGAHSAEADTLATFEVLNAQLEKYEGQNVEDALGKQVGVIENDMDKLHALTNKKMVDLAGRMIFNNKGEEIFNFGKHKGKLVSEVLSREPGYYDWMMRGDFPLDTKRRLTQIKLRNFNMK